jgi:hypothetical protein
MSASDCRPRGTRAPPAKATRFPFFPPLLLFAARREKKSNFSLSSDGRFCYTISYCGLRGSVHGRDACLRAISHSPVRSPALSIAEQVILRDDGVPRQFLSGGPYGQEVVCGQSALLSRRPRIAAYVRGARQCRVAPKALASWRWATIPKRKLPFPT